MRQGQQNNKRMRGRNRKGPNPLTRSYESNGPDVKIRGTALHIAEKYVQLARDAQASGDRVAAESYLQHAEHYYRIVAAAQAQMPQPQPVFRSDEEGEEDEERGDRVNGNGSELGNERQPFGGSPGAGLPCRRPALPQRTGAARGRTAEPNEDNRFEPREGFGEAAAYGREFRTSRASSTVRVRPAAVGSTAKARAASVRARATIGKAANTVAAIAADAAGGPTASASAVASRAREVASHRRLRRRPAPKHLLATTDEKAARGNVGPEGDALPG